MTMTLFNYIQSELIKEGFNEFIDDQGNLVFFDQDHQFMTKILNYDDDVSQIVDQLFHENKLKDPDHDQNFKKTFLYRFINRKINRQTIESFKLELLATFLNNADYINRIYQDVDQYLTQTVTTDQHNQQTNQQTNKQTNSQTNKQTSNQTSTQTNSQTNEGSQTTDNRQAFQDLPQNNVNIDVDNTILEGASDNTINRNKQVDQQETTGETEGTIEGLNDTLIDGETNVETDGETIGFNSGEHKTYQLDELIKSSGLMESVFREFDVKCFMQIW